MREPLLIVQPLAQLPATDSVNRIVFGGGFVSCSGRCMTNHKDRPPGSPDKPRYTWPWVVLGAVVLAIALAVAWMSKEVERARRIHDLNSPAPQTNRAGPDVPPS